MIKCNQCGAKLRRVHRTFLERFRYLAIYECQECDTETVVPRPYNFHLGPYCRCPHCGTYRLSRLKERDRIDGMKKGFLNLLERLGGGKLVHCRYCRVQFYDRRILAAESAAAQAPEMDAVKNR